MKHLYLFAISLACTLSLSAQWSITGLGVTNDTVTFDATFSGVNNGAYQGDGWTPSPTAGQLDSDGWKFIGLSDGDTDFGGSYTTGDYAKGPSSGGIFSGGIYAFEVAPGDTAVGVQPTGSDWTPGDMILRVINNTGEDVDSIYISYDLYINNNESRGNSFNFGWSINDSTTFQNVSALNETSTETSQGSVLWIASNKSTWLNAALNDQDTLYLAWSGADVTGSGSRDEFALDNIVVTLDTLPTIGTNLPLYDIATISTVDNNGVADSLGVDCSIKGVTVGVDLDGNNGYSFTLWDGAGINVFSFTDVDGYQMDEGDSLQLFGSIGQFNGLLQFEVDSIAHFDSNQVIPTPTLVTALDESTESELIRIEDFWVQDIDGIAFTLVNGSDTVVMRVDPDTDIPGNVEFAVGDTICYVIGIGGQFDSSNPYTDGYQMFPQRALDIDNSCGSLPPPVIPFYPIPDINNVDANGEPDSIGVVCWTKGVVLGVDLDGNAGLNFTLWDTEGINVFNFNDVDAYVVTEGDSLMVRGEIDFFRGLTEIFPDSIVVLNTGNTIPDAMVVTTLDETTESMPIRLENMIVADTSQWPNGGSSNVDIVSCDGDTLQMRIDSDTDVEGAFPKAPTGYFNVNGIGGQFDFDSPYFEGYQIFPMTSADIDTNVGPSMVPEIRINEAMSNNVSSETDENGENDPWVELYGSGDFSTSLAGLYFSNNAANQTQYQVPLASTENLASGGYKLIWCDNQSAQGDLHTNFTLSASGSFFGIYMENGCDMMTIDELTIPALGEDESFGYYPENTDSLVTFPSNSTTPGMMNMLDTTTSVGYISAEGSLVMYPNPASTGQLIRFNQVVSFDVFTLQGRLVDRAIETDSWSADHLSAGTYILKTKESEILKLIKQ
ncbi:MAG: hypothetical protein Salg2KO_08070 [Salibacteraceae bacterium]